MFQSGYVPNRYNYVSDKYDDVLWERHEAYLPMGYGFQGWVYTSVTLPLDETLEGFGARRSQDKEVCVVVPGKSESHVAYMRRIMEVARDHHVAVVGFDLYSMGLSSNDPMGAHVAMRSNKQVSHIDGSYERKMGRAGAVAVNVACRKLGVERINVIGHSTGYHAIGHMFPYLDENIRIKNMVLSGPFVKARVDVGVLPFGVSVNLGELGVIFNEVLAEGRDPRDIHFSQISHCRPIDGTWSEDEIAAHIDQLGWDRDHFSFLQHQYRKGGSYEHAQKVFATWGWLSGATSCASDLRSSNGIIGFGDHMAARGTEKFIVLTDPYDKVVDGKATARYAQKTGLYLSGNSDVQTYLICMPGVGHGGHHKKNLDGLYSAAFSGDVERLEAVTQRPALLMPGQLEPVVQWPVWYP